MDSVIILRTNSVNFLGRGLILIIIVFLVGMFIYQIQNNPNDEKGNGILIFEIVLFTFVFIGIVRSFFEISEVELDKSLKLIKLKTLFSEKSYKQELITGFYATYYRGSRGLILKMDNGKKFRLRQQNLKSIPDLKQYLEEESIQYLGEKM